MLCKIVSLTLIALIAITGLLLLQPDRWVASISIYTSAAELHVCPSGCPYATVQSAVDAANDGDVIKIAAGTYTGVSARAGVTQVVYISKSVTLQGGYTTNWTTPDPEGHPTTLDAQDQGRALYVIGGTGAVIDGLHITGGNAIGQLGGHLPASPEGSGGGMYVHGAVDPFGKKFTLINSHIFSNTAQQGGGVYLSFCCAIDTELATLRGNIFASNTAAQDGGGVMLHAGTAALTDNVFDSNTADRGGGFYAHCNGTQLKQNTFVANTANTAGGGLFLDMQCSEAKISETSIISNTAKRGGGLVISGLDPNSDGHNATLINTVIADNQASEEGGGLYIVSAYSVQLLHTTLARNGGDGSGLRIGDFAFRESGPSTVILTNTILVSQSVGLSITGGSTLTVNSILWYSTTINISQSPTATVSVQNAYWGDPAFVNSAAGDYHISAGSAAINKGATANIGIDLDAEPRLGIPDLGADEYWAPGALKRVYLPLAMKNQ